MTPEERSRKNGLAFLETLVGPGGFKIRPLGYLTLVNIKLLGLKFGSEKKEAAEKVRVPLDHVHAFLFIQAAPLVTVSRAVRAHAKMLATIDPLTGSPHSPEECLEEFMITAVEPWLAEIPAAAIEAAFEQLGQLDEIDAAAIVAEPPAGQKSEPPDPNS